MTHAEAVAQVAKDIHQTIRREIVVAFVTSLTPYQSGNALDEFLRGYDRNGLNMIQDALADIAQAEPLPDWKEAIRLMWSYVEQADMPDDVWRLIRDHPAVVAAFKETP